MYGHDVLYLPRQIVEEDTIFTEDVQSTFGDAILSEMYLSNVEGYEGQEDLVSKFGVDINDDAEFIMSVRTWERFVSFDSNLATSLRPNEGDLIYFPMTGHLFEINFVEDPDPFYQLGKIYVFKMQVSLFEYSGEDFDTGTSADLVETDQSLHNRTHNDWFRKLQMESLTTVINSVTTTVGEVVLWQPQSRKLTIKDNTRTLQVGDTLTGASSTTARPIGSIVDVLTFESTYHSAQNKDFEDKDSNYLDFSEVNPFGEP